MTRSDAARAASAPAPRGGRRELLRWISTSNPFYVLSALLFLAGLWISFGAQAEAVHPAVDHVEHDDRRPVHLERAHQLERVRRLPHLEAHRLQRLAQRLPHLAVVVDHRDRRGH